MHDVTNEIEAFQWVQEQMHLTCIQLLMEFCQQAWHCCRALCLDWLIEKRPGFQRDMYTLTGIGVTDTIAALTKRRSDACTRLAGCLHVC